MNIINFGISLTNQSSRYIYTWYNKSGNIYLLLCFNYRDFPTMTFLVNNNYNDLLIIKFY